MAKKTQTYQFGSSKREGHDASLFYERELYRSLAVPALSRKELLEQPVTAIEEWQEKVNRVYCHSSETMHEIPDNAVGLAFTSPPYNVGKEYDKDLPFEEYLALIERVGREVYRVLMPGGRYLINIANLGRNPYIPLTSYFWELHMRIGFLPMGEIIWQKGRGASGSCAWGSWLSAKSPRLRDVHEYILVLAKMSTSRPDKGISDIEKEEFLQASLSVWEIAPESARRVGHPAPFPESLAARVIRFYSYVGDVVLDPFAGSGTTLVAAANNSRYWVGYDIVREYCDLAERRVKEALRGQKTD